MNRPNFRPILLSLGLIAASMARGQTLVHAYPAIDLSILLQKKVLAELKADSSASNALAKLVRQMQEKPPVRIAGVDDMPKVERMLAERNEADEREARAALQKILNARQYKRFSELNLQALGVGAFHVKQVVSALALTEDQKRLVDYQTNQVDRLMATMMPPPPAEGEEGSGGTIRANPSTVERAKIREAQQKAVSAVVNSMTAAQKRQWTSMVGAKFEFDAS